MTNRNTGAAAKNQGTIDAPASTSASAGADAPLDIPAFVASAAAAAPVARPVLQEGEDPGVLNEGPAAQSAGMTGFGANQQTVQQQGGSPSAADMQRIADERLGERAQSRPAQFNRGERYQQADVARVEVDIPVHGSVDNMRRPDQYIEPIADLGRFKEKAEELAFLEEMVQIRIHESGDPDAENPVPLGINGRMVYITRGEDTWLRRKYVEQLLRAKPEGIRTEQRRTDTGDIRNVVHKTRALKYPFSVLRDDNPRGVQWERRIRAQG